MATATCRGCHQPTWATEEETGGRDFVCGKCYRKGIRFDQFGNRLPDAEPIDNYHERYTQ